MDQQKPSLEDIQSAFAVTRLEPEIPEETLIAFAAGRATAVERDLVETMLEVEPSLSELISAIQEELAAVHQPLPVATPVVSHEKKAGWLQKWISVGSTMVAVGACAAFVFTFIDKSNLASALHSKQHEVAMANDESQKNIQSLQKQIDSMEQQVKTATTDKQQMVAQLEQARNLLKVELDQRANAAAQSGGVESQVANALTHGLTMSAAIEEISISRGIGDLDIKMNPDRTAIRLPIKLSWSGPNEGIFRIEIKKGEEQVWKTSVSQTEATPPDGLLKPGNVYMWRVASGTKRSPWAGFRVCTKNETNQANSVARNSDLGPLEKGVVYANLGLVAEAEGQFKLLRASHPALADRFTKQLERNRK